MRTAYVCVRAYAHSQLYTYPLWDKGQSLLVNGAHNNPILNINIFIAMAGVQMWYLHVDNKPKLCKVYIFMYMFTSMNYDMMPL